MDEVIRVGIADYKLCKKPNTITTIGLGSCVGVVLYSLTGDYCGLLHVMLPDSKEISKNDNRAKFADTGIADMISALEEKGISRTSLLAKIAGGAVMFQFKGNPAAESVGTRNIKAVKQMLEQNNIKIVAEDTGANYGRTIIFDAETKILTVRAVGKGETKL
ncbi:MAG: chemotaxis protein CheD [Eubacteriales bacterium]|nr:chemotaxis protein CheD [Eubacteriales bacterium]